LEKSVDENIISLSKKTGDAFMQSPEGALKDALKETGLGGCFEGRKKILILSLDDAEDEYNVTFLQAGMTMSQCVSVCEVAKAIFLKEMNYT
jgi:hypothetical protein